MLVELRLVDLGVIAEASVELSPGFTAVTGETGAGKTMIVTGLGLLAGSKAEPRLVRAGASRALVEGRWSVPDSDAARLEELGAQSEGGEVLTARHLSANRSRMVLGGAQVPIGVAEGLLADWVTVHGQAEQIRLGTAERQREMLDLAAGRELATQARSYRTAFDRRRSLQRDLVELRGAAQSRLRELDLLRFGIAEIARVDPQPGEDRALAGEARRLQSVDDLRQAAQAALLALAGDESAEDRPTALGLLGEARRAVSGAAATDPELAVLSRQVDAAAAEFSDVASQLASYLSGLDADPARLEWVAGRRAELQGLTRKYGDTIDDVLAHARRSEQRAAELEGAESRIEEVSAESARLDAELAERARTITDLRTRAAAALESQVRVELAALALPKARLSFEIVPLAELGPHGADQISLLFAAHPGAQPGPLGKVASGGELSRVRLALEVVLAGGSPGHTFVFDEVDAGIGGTVALEVGARLARLAQHAQVIVVTHLAQVAAFADRHYVVSKADDGQVTTSGVSLVTQDERLEVLARMMGGLESSDSALAHARELLASVRR